MQTWRKSRVLKPDFNKVELEVCPATKFFDQLSFIGDEIVGCFVLEVDDGYVLIDCMNPDERSIEIIEQGFRDLNFDIRKLKAILISHGHGDHYGRADYFKEKYGAHIYMSHIDESFAKNMPDSFPWKPIEFEVDVHLEDQEKIYFGSTWVLPVFTPGHSDGCFSFIFPVSDEGREHYVALWGGSGILPGSNVADYEKSLKKFTKICQQYHVDSEIATHPCLDNGLLRYALVRNIVNGVPNPFVIGESGYHYYEQQFYQLVKNVRKNLNELNVEVGNEYS